MLCSTSWRILTLFDRDGKEEARFEALIDRAERAGIDFHGLRELAALYRIQSAKLSQLKLRSRDPERARYLNALCLRAYPHVYAPPARSAGSARLWLSEVPGTLGRSLRLQLLASCLMALGTLLGAQVVLEDGSNVGAVVPSSMYDETSLQELYRSPETRAEFLAHRDASNSVKSLFASSLFAHNTRIGLLGLAAGILLAAPTAILLVYNGLVLGGFGAIFMRGPEWLDFLAWIIPHAIPELLAIVLCSAGGLSMGLSVLAPGRRGRRAALGAAAQDALHLFVAAIPLFLIAALIESFVRQSLLSTTGRFGVASAVLSALVAYVLLARHYAARQPPVDVGFLR